MFKKVGDSCCSVKAKEEEFGGGLEVQRPALPCGDEVLQPEVGDESGKDDGERRGEAFEDVVGVLDDRRDDQTAQRLEKNDKQAEKWMDEENGDKKN